MKFRKIISSLLLVCILLTFTACKSGAASAKELTNDLMTALTTYDLVSISSCVEDIPDNTGTSSVVDIYTSDYFKDIYAAANANISFTIESSSAKEVVVKVQMPDLPALHEKWTNTVTSGALSDAKLQETLINGTSTIDPNLIVPAYMLGDIKDNGVSTVEKEVKLSIVKINGEYKIKNDDQLKYLLSSGLSELVIYAQPEAEEQQ